MANAAEKYRDWWLRQQHALHRVENGVANELIGNLSTAKLEIQAQLERAENAWTGLNRDLRLSRLNNLVDDIDLVMAEANRLNTELLTGRLTEIGMTQADLVGDRVQGMFTGTDIVINRLPIEQVFAMVEQPLGGLQFAERMAKNYGDAVYNMKAALTQSVIQGEDMAQAGRRLLGRGATIAGLEGKKLKDRMDMIARTEIQRVSNEAARAVYDANTDVIKGLQYVATLDRRTCLICGGDDGKVYYYNKNIDSAPLTPRHPRCRCFYSPATYSWRELGIDKDEAPPGTRASLDGQVPATETYPEWFAKQNVGWQKDYLGPTRYKLWSEGKLKLTEMAKDNKIILVRDLKKKFPETGFIPAKTIKDAESWARKNLLLLPEQGKKLPAFHLDYSGIDDVDVANRINETLFGLQERYTAKYGAIKTVDLPPDLLGYHTAAQTRTIQLGDRSISVLEINSNVFKSKKTLRAFIQTIPSGMFENSTARGIITHEYGHLLTHDSKTIKKLDKIYATWTKSKLASKYASYSSSEMAAEGFVIFEYAGARQLRIVGLDKLEKIFKRS